METNIYRGFSTSNWLKNKTFALYNLDLVKHDLLNAIWTVPGTRVMMPSWGTRIPLLTFEPCDNETVEIIRSDLTKVFDQEPRVKLLSLNIMKLPDNNVIIAIANLRYIEFNVTQELKIEVPTQ